MNRDSNKLLKIKLWRSKELGKIKTGLVDILLKKLKKLERRNETLNKIIDQLIEQKIWLREKNTNETNISNDIVNNYRLFITRFTGEITRSFLKIPTYKIARGQN